MMTREILDRILDDLKEEILELESMVRQATLDSVNALISRDYDTSRRVYHGDRHINEKRFELEKNCIAAIATQQPMAADLRTLASILEISTELERMGDYAKGIARINFMLEGKQLLAPIQTLPEMAEIAADMLSRSVRAFVDGDVEEARALPVQDDKVDACHNQISKQLIEIVSHDGEKADMANTLQWAVHNIERMADRVLNICERTIYMVTGRMNEFESSDDELGPVK